MRYTSNIVSSFLLSLVGLFLFNCTVSNGQIKQLIRLEEDRVPYTGELIIHFENTREQNIAIITTGCGTKGEQYLPSFTIEKQEQGNWVRAGAPVCIAIATPPIELKPGEKRTMEIPVHMGLEDAMAPGQFRYVFDIREEVNGEYPVERKLSKEERSSTVFTIYTEK